MVNKLFLKSFLILTFLFIILVAYFMTSRNNAPILLGSSLPTTGITKELGRDVTAGANAWFNHINQTGGIHGRPLHLIYYDDKYEPQHTANNLRTLTQLDNIFALFGLVGTPTVKKILPTVLEKEIPFIAPLTGASFLRTQKNPNIINFRSSYQAEISNIVDYLYLTQGIKKFAVFYQNDDYGEDGYIAAVKALKKHGLTLHGEGTYKRNTLSIRHALHEIKNAKPEAIIIVGAYKPSAHFIQQARDCCMDDVIFCPISFVNADALIQELQGKTQNILFSQVVPSYDTKDLQIAQTFQKLLKHYDPSLKPSFVSFEAFLAAKALTAALERISPPLTRSKLLKVFQTNDHIDLEGLPINLNYHNMLTKSYLFTYEAGQFITIERRKE